MAHVVSGFDDETPPDGGAPHRPAARPVGTPPSGGVERHREGVVGRGSGGTAGGPPANDVHDRDSLAVPSGLAASEGEGDSSNTPSPKTTSGGEDWLSVNFHVDFPHFEELTAQLDLAQAAAITLDNKGSFKETPEFRDEIELEGIRFIVSPRGGRLGAGSKALGMKWRLQSEHGLSVLIANMPTAHKTVPNVNIVAASLPLMRKGFVVTWRLMQDYLLALGCLTKANKISRVDACVDLVDVAVDQFSDPFSMDWVVSRARQRDAYESGVFISNHKTGRHSTGFAVGKSPLRLRVYDKLTESRKSPEKLALLEATRWGCIPARATRVEFQLSRTKLKQFGVDSVEDWVTKRATILDKLTHDWFRLTDGPVDVKHANRASVHPIWEKTRQAFFEWCDGPRDEPLMPLPKLHVDMSKQVKQMIGMFTGICARVGKDIKDNEHYYREFLFAIRDVVGDRNMSSEVHRKALESGNPIPSDDPWGE